MNKPSLTIIVLTYNEQKHIRRCLSSLMNIAERIIIVDSYSTDLTEKICMEFGSLVEFKKNKWINYANQFQWALDNSSITTDWVMRMDADEYIEDDLESEILYKLNSMSADINAITIRRKYFYKGKWIKYGGVYPLNLLRIWRTGCGRIEQRWMDEHIIVSEAKNTTFSGHIVDDNLNDMRWWTEKHIKYADREVVDLLNIKHHFLKTDNDVKLKGGIQEKIKRILKENIYFSLSPSLRSFLYFIYRYFFRFGFMDGGRGWDYHLMQGLWYRSYVDIRYKELDIVISSIKENKEKIKVLSSLTGLEIN